MLIINWKKHYYVPSIFYNDTRFTSTRKGKFFFLSDFAFRIIHKYCFKLCLFYYVKYLFYYRFQKSCLLMNNNLSSPLRSLKQNVTQILYQLSTINIGKVFHSENIDNSFTNKNKLIINYNFYTYFFLLLKKNLLNKKNKYVFFYNLYFNIKKKNIFHFFCFYIFNSIYKCFSFKKKNIFFNTNNITLLLYQVLLVKKCSQYYFYRFYSTYFLCSIYKIYIKHAFVNDNKFLNSIFMKHSFLKTKILFFLEKLKIKNMFYFHNNWKKNYLLYLNSFANNFHDLSSYFFSLKKLKMYKSLHFLSYVNYNSLTVKKNLILKFKKQFRVFKKKFTKYKARYVYKFYKFLIRVLYVKKNWLLGPVHKMKFFKYLFFMYKKIKNTFKKLYFLNSPYFKKKRKLSFFFDSTKIREHFFIYLGKKRYSEEFLLLKNKKWYFKFYLKQYYNTSFNFIINLYYYLRYKFKVKQIKDLFFFLEFSLPIFLKKHIFYDDIYSSIKMDQLIINNIPLSKYDKHFFFIGDYIKLKNKTHNFFYYEKLFIFFNIIYFINPFFFKKKQLFLHKLYKKLFFFFYTRFDKSSFLSKIILTINKFPVSTSSFLKKVNNFLISHLSFFSYNKNDKLFIKTLFLFFSRYNFLSNIIKKNIFFISEKNTELDHFSINTLLYIYSFDKTFDKLRLINFNIVEKNQKKRIKKPFWWFKNIKRNKRYWRYRFRTHIKKKINLNVFKFIKYSRMLSTNKTKTLFYDNSILKKMNKENYSAWWSKKKFYLNRKNLYFNKIHKLNF